MDEPDKSKGVPSNFGGASGGGVWKVPLSGDQKKQNIKTGQPILSGVIYFQTDARTLLAHGPMSIYDRVYDRLRQER